MTRCEINPRAGGAFHYEWAGPDGNSFFFSGPVLAVDRSAPHDGMWNTSTATPSSGATITTDLAARSTGTRMTMLMRYNSAETRAAAIATGMTDGMEEVYGKLDALAITG